MIDKKGALSVLPTCPLPAWRHVEKVEGGGGVIEEMKGLKLHWEKSRSLFLVMLSPRILRCVITSFVCFQKQLGEYVSVSHLQHWPHAGAQAYRDM